MLCCVSHPRSPPHAAALTSTFHNKIHARTSFPRPGLRKDTQSLRNIRDFIPRTKRSSRSRLTASSGAQRRVADANEKAARAWTVAATRCIIPVPALAQRPQTVRWRRPLRAAAACRPPAGACLRYVLPKGLGIKGNSVVGSAHSSLARGLPVNKSSEAEFPPRAKRWATPPEHVPFSIR